MKPNYSISIPKPCHEDWSQMTPNEKGRFCQSCSKTVVDFTTMNTKEIQNYLHNNRNQRICGHIRQSQLDTINLKIPETVFSQSLNFHGLFILALLFSMGITLFNCEDEKGNTKKIESIEIVEVHQKSNDTIITNKSAKKTQLDTVCRPPKKSTSDKSEVTEQQLMDGMMIIETVGDINADVVDINDIEPIDIDSLELEGPPHCPGPESDVIFGMIIERPPEFKNSDKDLSQYEKKKLLSDSISKVISKNFDKDLAEHLNLKGKQRIYTQFTINEIGEVENIKVRAPHPLFEKEATRVIKLLPQFKPAQQRGRNVASVYSLPIVFVVKD